MTTTRPEINGFETEHFYQEAVLGQVVTLPEACLLWGKSRSTLIMALAKMQIRGRRSLTDGSWLITFESMERRYGRPNSEILKNLYSEPAGK